MFNHFHVRFTITSYHLLLHPPFIIELLLFEPMCCMLVFYDLHTCFVKMHFIPLHLVQFFQILNYNFNVRNPNLKINKTWDYAKLRSFYLFYHQGFGRHLFLLSRNSCDFGGSPIIHQFASDCRSLFLSCYETQAHPPKVTYILLGDFAISIANNSHRATKSSIDK
jgi:hypothetical protein